VLKDVNLNLQNSQKICPLTAFIRERPFNGVDADETGAILSMYLDALLWKDPRQRIPNRININARDGEGATALYHAAVRGRPDSVRSLVEAGANVNARIGKSTSSTLEPIANNDTGVTGDGLSILQAALNAKSKAVEDLDAVGIERFNNVLSYLQCENAVTDPTLLEERAVTSNSVVSLRL